MKLGQTTILKNYFFRKILGVSYLLFILCGCEKGWLEAKPEKSLVVPTTISDYQALFDNSTNGGGTVNFNVKQNSLCELAAGDLYILDANLTIGSTLQKNTYGWNVDIYGGGKEYTEWQIPYQRIFVSNIVLEGLDKIAPKNNFEQTQWNLAKGSGYFHRAFNHYTIAQDYCKTYNKATASSDLGIPLRLESDINLPSIRSTVQETYEQIIIDLKNSVVLLPVAAPELTTSLYKLRPTKAAANAMLARVYLQMNDYDSALVYASKTLQLYDKLIDFNTDLPTITATNFPIARFREEVIFHMLGNNFALLNLSRVIVDSILYQSYNINDLRKLVFLKVFNGFPRFFGSYDGSGSYFEGLATDEVYLIRAECYARKGNTSLALQDLNTLMIKRWKSTAWTPFTANNANEALFKILVERHKELCFRGVRWSDLRRLNLDPQFAVSLTKVINGQQKILPPNDSKYVFPIPDDVIRITGMQQNIRN